MKKVLSKWSQKTKTIRSNSLFALLRTFGFKAKSLKSGFFALSISAICIGTALFPISATENETSKWQRLARSFLDTATEPGAVLFTPPDGWSYADPEALPATVKAMVVGKGKNYFPPSINLGIEPFDGNLKQYLKKVKEINHAHGTEWQDLGKIRTEAGNASLSQVDIPSEWGLIRLMHVILIQNGHVYILTASALKEEFQQFYKDFFSSLRSLRFNPLISIEEPKPSESLK